MSLPPPLSLRAIVTFSAENAEWRGPEFRINVSQPKLLVDTTWRRHRGAGRPTSLSLDVLRTSLCHPDTHRLLPAAARRAVLLALLLLGLRLNAERSARDAPPLALDVWLQVLSFLKGRDLLPPNSRVESVDRVTLDSFLHCQCTALQLLCRPPSGPPER